jgi:hypothetical protein
MLTHPFAIIRRGDTIVSVNGRSGRRFVEGLYELRTAMELLLFIERDAWTD